MTSESYEFKITFITRIQSLLKVKNERLIKVISCKNWENWVDNTTPIISMLRPFQIRIVKENRNFYDLVAVYQLTCVSPKLLEFAF